MKTTGIIITLIGIGLSLFTAATFYTNEKVVDLGIVQVTHNQPHHLNWSPYWGIAIMIVGIILFFVGRKKR